MSEQSDYTTCVGCYSASSEDNLPRHKAFLVSCNPTVQINVPSFTAIYRAPEGATVAGENIFRGFKEPLYFPQWPFGPGAASSDAGPPYGTVGSGKSPFYTVELFGYRDLNADVNLCDECDPPCSVCLFK